jgi:hypothetical protein
MAYLTTPSAAQIIQRRISEQWIRMDVEGSVRGLTP